MKLHADLLIRLHEDAARAVTRLLHTRAPDATVTPLTVTEVLVHLTEDGRFVGYVEHAETRGLRGYTLVDGDPCTSWAGAVCALIERVHADLDSAGEVPPHDLLGQLAQDAQAIEAYQTLVKVALPMVVHGAVAAVERLADAATERDPARTRALASEARAALCEALVGAHEALEALDDAAVDGFADQQEALRAALSRAATAGAPANGGLH